MVAVVVVVAAAALVLLATVVVVVVVVVVMKYFCWEGWLLEDGRRKEFGTDYGWKKTS